MLEASNCMKPSAEYLGAEPAVRDVRACVAQSVI